MTCSDHTHPDYTALAPAIVAAQESVDERKAVLWAVREATQKACLHKIVLETERRYSGVSRRCLHCDLSEDIDYGVKDNGRMRPAPIRRILTVAR